MTTINFKIKQPTNAPQKSAQVIIRAVAAVGSNAPAYDSNGQVVGPTVLDMDGSGAASVDLIPNASLTPVGNVYKATLIGGGDIEPEQAFTAPSAGGPYNLQDVLVVMPGSLPGTTHGEGSHAGDILPDGANQTMGAAFLEFDEISDPGAPTGNRRRLFVNSATHKLSIRTPSGIVPLE